MSAVVFRARDACQRQHLLGVLEDALGLSDVQPDLVEHVARHAYEGEDTSLYVWSLYFRGFLEGHDFRERAAWKQRYEELGRDYRAAAGARPQRDRSKQRQTRQARKRNRAKR